jgi:hypothetical protein
MSKKTPLSKPVSIRLSPPVRSTVAKISEETGLMQAQIYEFILRAGCLAIEEKGRRLELPLRFEIKE